MTRADPIVSRRLSFEVLEKTRVDAIRSGATAVEAFAWPPWWPDEHDRPHVAHWQRQAPAFDGLDEWRPRAVVDAGAMVGHVGFHLPPRSMADALSDPSFEGTVPQAAGGVVEIGYRIFPDWQRRGYATEAATTLVDWAFSGDNVAAVLAAVATDNAASLAVLDRVGGFVPIGTCRDDGAIEVVLCRFSASRT